MSGWVIVALPSVDDAVNEISSEDAAHLTILYLGEQTDPAKAEAIFDFMKHSAETSLHRFNLEVDYRGTLGSDDADVVFFQKNSQLKPLEDLRADLLKNPAIKDAYDSVEQFPGWTPHMTLGYPATPAHEDKRDYPGVNWVNFDRIALWTGDSMGPEIQLHVPSTDDILAHFGILGMKWGRRKDRKPQGSSNPGHQDRDAKRKANSAKILAKAKAKQQLADDLRKNGVNSKYMREKYGDAIAIDSRAADIRIGLLNQKHSKKELLQAEINGALNDKKHFEEDAKAAAAGRPTSKQKMLIGAGITLAIVGGAVGAAVLVNNSNSKKAAAEVLRLAKQKEDWAYAAEQADKLQKFYDSPAQVAKRLAEKTRFDGIKPGENLSYEDWWKKLENTEIKRVGAISKDAFEGMSDAPIQVPPGTIFHRISTADEKTIKSRIYASFKDEDVNRYKATLPTFWERWGFSSGKANTPGYDVSLKAKTALTSPGQKTRVKAFIDLLDKDISGVDPTYGGSPQVMKGREWLDTLTTRSPSNKSNSEEALSRYKEFALGLAGNNPLNNAYFDSLKNQGFNALVDDNDAGKLSDLPMIIFNANKTMETAGNTPISSADIQKARETLTELLNRG